MLRSCLAVLFCLAAACSEERGDAASGDAQARAAPADRDTWWNTATQRASGREHVLSPRELRALLAEGRGRGFDGDAEWWTPRSHWAYERVLTLAPDDVEANAGVGRKTLQSIEGFDDAWSRMLDTRAPSAAIDALLDRYGPDVATKNPVFLYADEYKREGVRLAEAVRHLDRLDRDAEYASVHRALAHVRTSHLGDYPFVHVRVGPFMVYYAARDLQRIPGEEEESENRRLANRKEYYLRRLAAWQGVYAEVVKDLEKLYPKLWREKAPKPGKLLHQWIFGERSWYDDFLIRVHLDEPEPPYRDGFFHRRTGWAYLVEPAGPDSGGDEPKEQPRSLEETAAYLAATQLLYDWAWDLKDPLVNHLDRSEDYWFKEGWPSFVAARRMKRPAVGPALSAAKATGWPMPDVIAVVERRSRLERPEFALRATDAEGAPAPDGGYTDLAWRLVSYLHGDPKRQASFERFLRAEVEGKRRGVEWFEECFGVADSGGWEAFQRKVYAGID